MGSLGSRLLNFFALSWLVLGLLTVVFSFLACLLGLPRPWAVVGLAVHVVGLLIPLRMPPPAWASRLLTFLTAATRDYFPINIIFEDKDCFMSQRPFIVGYEPHSVLPLGACMFLPHAQGMPPALTNSRMASTSTVFLAPYMRHLVYWLGSRSASREVLMRTLAEGTTVVLCPGGVRECLYMDPLPDREVVFLRQRFGFIRLAMQAGVPVVPVFAFGQTPHYSYWRPFIDWPKQLIPRDRMGSFVRRIGYVPMLMWGWLGTTQPRRVPMHIVVGRPIQVPHKADPSAEEVQTYLGRYISALSDIFERHKAAVGHPDATLTVI